MANITSKRTGELVKAVLKLLIDNPDGLPPREVFRQLEKTVPPTAYENTMYEKFPSIRRYNQNIRFYTVGCVKAGWMTKPRGGQAGKWVITEAGRKAYKAFPDPESLLRERDRLYRQWAEDQPAKESQEEATSDSPSSDQALASSLEDAADRAQQDIEAYLERMDPFDFQDLIAALLRAMGYQVDWVSDPGPDKGIDIVAFSEPHGMKGVRIKVQVKRRKDKVGSEMLSSFLNRLADNDVGLYVCTGGFSRDAEEEARKERKYVRLIDMDRLISLWIDFYPKMREADKRLLPLEPVYFISTKADTSAD